ncbi:uncharacterized protein LOC121735456 [Aricia agestis]|uniref:uncharacterized protein LOC121735456 n=1 Tax=Aricia agestis TaxID=91739 RepID=UPI001C203F3E|nr:uncharacterized protein LOC121735456 [Aricia agestis]
MDLDTDPPDPGGGNRKRPNNDVSEPVAKKISSNAHSVPSIQLHYVNPEFADKKLYGSDDAAPYIVQVSKPETDSILSPILFGQFLFKNNVHSVKMDGIKRIGRNRISIEFKTPQDANSFIDLPAVVSAGYTVVIPSYSVSRMGIIRNVPVDWSMEELVENLQVPVGYGKVVKARRMSRRTSNEQNSSIWLPTQSVVITVTGQKLPTHVYCFYNSLPVEIYKLPTIQCNNCCRFGHVKAQCRSLPRCYKCSQKHEGSTCNASTFTCLHCGGPHAANDVSCPEYCRQKEIKLVMSQENIPYMEASARFPHVKRSFADLARTSPSAFASISRQTDRLTKSPTTTSYRKTVYVPRRPIPPRSPGYDHQAHRNLIEEPISQAPNGCAYPLPSEISSISPNDNLLDNLTLFMIDLISRFSDSLPNKTLANLTQLANLLPKDGLHCDTVERPQHKE